MKFFKFEEDVFDYGKDYLDSLLKLVEIKEAKK